MTSSGEFSPLRLDSEHSLSRAHHPAKLERYARGRTRALGMAGHLRGISVAPDPSSPLDGPEAAERASKLERCGGYLEFRDYVFRDEVRLHAAKFCQQDKLCPVCALRRAGRMIRNTSERVLAVLAATPTLVPYLVTTTVRDGPDLVERLAHLRRGLQLLNQRRKNALRGAGSSVMADVAAGVWSIELKRGSGSGLWHPHSHAVWLCPSPPCADRLSREWKDITGDSHIVDVRPFLRPADPAADLCEVFKYALKLGDLSFADNVAAWMCVRGRHLIGSFGLLRGLDLAPDLLDDSIDLEPYIELLYLHQAASGYRLLSASQCGTVPHHEEESRQEELCTSSLRG